MNISYEDLSSKVSEKWALIRKKKKSDQKNAYENLCVGIERFLPFIKEHLEELRNISLRELSDVSFLISNQSDILKKCTNGFSQKDRIESLKKDIDFCYNKNIRPVVQEHELSRLQLQESELERCKKLCNTLCFRLLSSFKKELNIEDEKELRYAFSLICDWREIQDNIISIEYDEMLDDVFDVESPHNGEALEDNTVSINQENANNEHDILLQEIFGEHLNNFLNDARTLKKGSDVARLVKFYIRNMGLKKDKNFNKPLWEALKSKGIISIQISAWNNAMI